MASSYHPKSALFGLTPQETDNVNVFVLVADSESSLKR